MISDAGENGKHGDAYEPPRDRLGAPRTYEELAAAELRIIEGPAPPPIGPTDLERLLVSEPDLLEKVEKDLPCWGRDCSDSKPCPNCISRRKYFQWNLHRLNYGKPQHPSDAARYDTEAEPPPSDSPSSPASRNGQARHEPEAEEKTGYQFKPLDSAAFAVADYRPAWLVRRLLVRGQPCVIGGPKKSLKTSLLIDMALSLATGTPFLGFFDVKQRARVAVLSGESGPHTIQETARRICQAKDVDLAGADVFWSFDLPQLAKPADLLSLKKGLKENGVAVAILDPLYVSLLAGGQGVQASSMYDMGPLLLSVSQSCLSVGCTPILAHHFRQSRGANYDPPQLEDLAFAGIQEFARQWILLGRRETYEPGTGQHRLWLSSGGSIGHGGLWAVDVGEGELADDFSGRRWEVRVSTANEVRQAERETKASAAKEREREREAAAEKKLLDALDKFTSGKPASLRKLREIAGLSGEKANAVVFRLKQQGIIEECSAYVIAGQGQRPVPGIRRRD